MRARTVLAACALAAAWGARATPSTTFWAPSTTYVQPWLVPHVTYDTYFGGGPGPASGRTSAAGAPNPALYPVTTGLTMGVLPWRRLQLEVGFDLLLPSTHPLLVNAKLGTPEGTLFPGSPSLAAGAFAIGTSRGATAWDILYAQVQKNAPWGGYLSAGGYYGAGTALLWRGSDGRERRAGFMAGAGGPDLRVPIPGLKKIVPVADVQTGRNVFGAAGGGLVLYFTDAIDVITGPVFFLDHRLQPGGRTFFWTVQLDIDVTLLAPRARAP
jgi:hypothetical protein